VADLDVSITLAARGVDVAFQVAAGEVLAVVGPNGAGKSTTAAVVAGLLSADRAVVRVGQRTLTDTAAGVNVAIHDRRVGVLLQEPLLFPHLSVLGNVLFAARSHPAGHPDARARARHWLERVGASELAGRRPGELSGGQAQRVALARALAAEPDVVLLDEPLAGLDVAAAGAIRTVLRELLAQAESRSRPAVLITHDLLDILGLADRVLVLEQGRAAESGSTAEVLATPRSRFGARIAGVNMVRGVLSGPTTARCGGMTWHGIPAGGMTVGDPIVAIFAPAAVAVYSEPPHGSPRNAVAVRVGELHAAGGVVRVRAAEQADGTPGLAADVTPEAVADLRLALGDEVWFVVKTQAVGLHADLRSD
jgi:molybdate transport system ATP-binding protein